MFFKVHTPATAPTGSRPQLESTERRLGFIPNLTGELAESPAALEGYLAASAAFAKSSFTALERELILVAVSVEDGCHYCTAAHTTSAEWQGVDLEVIAAVRDDRPVADRRLEALRRFVLRTVRARGWVSDTEVQAFIDAGFSKAAVLEVALGIGLKTFSNTVNHITETPLDAAFQPHAFTPARRVN